MSYALALGLDQTLVARLKAIGPPCYSADLDDCLMGKNPSYSHCAELRSAFESHKEEWWKYTDVSPWCPLCYEGPAAEAQTKIDASVSKGVVAVAVLSALAAGMIAGVALYGLS